ncbi:FecCD family ABC transporter permease [Ammonifex thiophilus]|uniref:FecCD family ABC transporter permease n=1 Tax=Ammonifex thiophilus TaxID=444093 RepID=UPI001F0BAA6A|nr:iron ABC transporter permease [Ammonifex thiophilus]
MRSWLAVWSRKWTRPGRLSPLSKAAFLRRLAAGGPLVGLAVLLVGVFFLSFFLGPYPVPPLLLLKVLLAQVWSLPHTWSPTVEIVVLLVRLPRIVAAVLAGAALSVAGAAYQGMFRNPLVSPDILGVSAGACFGAALAIYLSWGFLAIEVSSFSWGLLAVLLACLAASRVRHDPVLALVLSGILVGTLFSSALALIKYLADPYDQLPAITFWLMGGLGRVTLPQLKWMIAPVLLGVLPLFLLRWRLNVLSLGEEEARALGLNTAGLRLLVVFCSTLATAATVAVSGMIGWVGLVIPHLARILVGPDYRRLLPASLLLGSSYLLLVDDLARSLSVAEIPLSILTSLVGAPFFFWLLLHTRRGWA